MLEKASYVCSSPLDCRLRRQNKMVRTLPVITLVKLIFMYTTLWIKYLPVIRILLKKSLKEEQVFLMNVPDFERAGLKRKTGLKFFVKLQNGKPENAIVDIPVAASLVSVLQQDEALEALLAANEFHIGLNTKYELTITHHAGPAPETEEQMALTDDKG
ncbi:MAG TPA: hypothetical protein VFL47_12835 [Flavisolibacter sp.]|nr:hypothetical protein [Flavisolibacter sp.]